MIFVLFSFFVFYYFFASVSFLLYCMELAFFIFVIICVFGTVLALYKDNIKKNDIT